MKNGSFPNNKKSRIVLLHQYYTYTGFYKFILNSLKKAVLPVVICVIAFLILDKFVIDFSDLFYRVAKTSSPISLFSLFFTSESILGLIPPELFIAWVKTTSSPILNLSILALLSYLGGVVSYGLGKLIVRIPSLNKALEGSMSKHIANLRKFGAALILVGALLPVPFSMVSIASGMINYKFRTYLMWGLFRFLRFYLYAIAIFSLVA
ncbi:MAG: VTT domain-containing protein [Marinifilaceae bacterium]|jgi:membrane protein YqaA with SNARE-associated domain|nr:VTT domain-containing protein [Marinifilaceae bacterium]